MSLFVRRTIYLAFSGDRVVLRDFQRRQELALPAVVTLGNQTVRSVGDINASEAGSRQSWPFRHARVVVDDFEIAEVLLRYALQEFIRQRILIKPRLILHPLRFKADELTLVELRALRELAACVGARALHIYSGEELLLGSEQPQVEFVSLDRIRWF